jgi:hypothetical protein
MKISDDKLKELAIKAMEESLFEKLEPSVDLAINGKQQLKIPLVYVRNLANLIEGELS